MTTTFLLAAISKTLKLELFTTRQLAIILLLASADMPIDFGACARELGLFKPVMSRACDSLIGFGFLKRVRREDDMRKVWLSLTPKGKAFVASMVTP